MRFVFILDGVL